MLTPIRGRALAMRLAHGFAVPLRFWIDPIARRPRDDVTAFSLIVAPKCQYTSDWESVIVMPYDARLLSGVTVLMAVVEAGSMARAAGALGLTSSGVGRAIGRLERGSACGFLSALHAP
jgi:hypothetical protein